MRCQTKGLLRQSVPDKMFHDEVGDGGESGAVVDIHRAEDCEAQDFCLIDWRLPVSTTHFTELDGLGKEACLQSLCTFINSW